MGLVFARESGVRKHGETPVYFTEGEAWDDSHPFVRANRSLFTERPSRVRGERPESERVERATNRPGERRG